MKTIAFDVDGTLIDDRDTPRYDVVQLFKSFEYFGFKMYVWSGGGVDYATHWARKMGLNAEVVVKGSFTPDIAVDDIEDCTLGTVNIHVGKK
jgi:hydroxymethylpyrimidine pyrophosphatase-like HAD family hydrolase